MRIKQLAKLANVSTSPYPLRILILFLFFFFLFRFVLGRTKRRTREFFFFFWEKERHFYLANDHRCVIYFLFPLFFRISKQGRKVKWKNLRVQLSWKRFFSHFFLYSIFLHRLKCDCFTEFSTCHSFWFYLEKSDYLAGSVNNFIV